MKCTKSLSRTRACVNEKLIRACVDEKLTRACVNEKVTKNSLINWNANCSSSLI